MVGKEADATRLCHVEEGALITVAWKEVVGTFLPRWEHVEEATYAASEHLRSIMHLRSDRRLTLSIRY